MRSVEQGLIDSVFSYISSLNCPMIIADQRGTASKEPMDLLSIDDCIDIEDGFKLSDRIEWFINKYHSPLKFWDCLNYLNK